MVGCVIGINDLLKLEKRIIKLHDLFADMAILVQPQGAMLNT